MSDELKNGKENEGWSIDWSQSDELDLSEFDEVEELEKQFWAPYDKRHGTTHAEERRSDAPRSRAKVDYDDFDGDDDDDEEEEEPWNVLDEPFTERERRSMDREDEREQSRKRHGIPWVLKLLIYAVFVLGGSLLCATIGWVTANDVLSLNKPEAIAEITLRSNTTIDELAEQLQEQGIIEYPALFKLYCNFAHAEDKLVTGQFELNADMDYHAVVSALSTKQTSVETVNVTIPEGYTVDQIFELLVEKRVCSDVDELEKIAAEHDYDFDFLSDVELGDYHRLEGYLFPDTYEFNVGQDPLYVINKMLQNFDSKFDEEMRQQAGDMGYTVAQILTIASMIEKETNGTDSRNIASVIYNRLETGATGGLLQVDATIQYVLELQGGGRKENLTSEDLLIDSPYNTYLYMGLPAGPICNPSLASIQAALNPNDTNYLYYLHDKYGNSYFFEDADSFAQGKEIYLAEDYVAEQDDTNYEDFEETEEVTEENAEAEDNGG